MTVTKARTLILAVVCLLLSSCGVNNAILRTSAPVDLKSKGVAILSLGYAGTAPPYQNYWVQISAPNQTATDLTFFASPNNMFGDSKLTLVSSKGTTDLVALDLSPGEYRVEKVGAFSDTGPYSWGGLKRPPLVATTFSVVAGEVSYLGSALLQRNADGSFGYVVSDESGRDVGIFRSIRPEFGSLPVRKSLLSSKAAL